MWEPATFSKPRATLRERTETQLSFTRYYNSFDASSAGLGVGWHSTFHRGLSVTNLAVTVTRADWRQDIYTKTGSSYVADPDVTSVLTPVPATGTQTGWKLKLPDDSTENYTLAGFLPRSPPGRASPPP
jgi:Domain of unknown function (DUF6531)